MRIKTFLLTSTESIAHINESLSSLLFQLYGQLKCFNYIKYSNFTVFMELQY